MFAERCGANGWVVGSLGGRCVEEVGVGMWTVGSVRVLGRGVRMGDR